MASLCVKESEGRRRPTHQHTSSSSSLDHSNTSDDRGEEGKYVPAHPSAHFCHVLHISRRWARPFHVLHTCTTSGITAFRCTSCAHTSFLSLSACLDAFNLPRRLTLCVNWVVLRQGRQEHHHHALCQGLFYPCCPPHPQPPRTQDTLRRLG